MEAAVNMFVLYLCIINWRMFLYLYTSMQPTIHIHPWFIGSLSYYAKSCRFCIVPAVVCIFGFGEAKRTGDHLAAQAAPAPSKAGVFATSCSTLERETTQLLLCTPRN